MDLWFKLLIGRGIIPMVQSANRRLREALEFELKRSKLQCVGSPILRAAVRDQEKPAITLFHSALEVQL